MTTQPTANYRTAMITREFIEDLRAAISAEIARHHASAQEGEDGYRSSASAEQMNADRIWDQLIQKYADK